MKMTSEKQADLENLSLVFDKNKNNFHSASWKKRITLIYTLPLQLLIPLHCNRKNSPRFSSNSAQICTINVAVLLSTAYNNFTTELDITSTRST